jgi:gas vesicle protein
MTTDPDQIRTDIETTRDNLSTDVNALAYKASPDRMVKERTDRFRGAFHGIKDKVMGAASDHGGHRNSAISTVSDTASSVSDSTAAAPAKAKDAAEGNPLAAGLIVFGAAWLISSLLPRTQREHQAAEQVKTAAKEHTGQIKEAVGDAAHQMQEDLREPVQEATESVKSNATNAAQTVKDDTKSATQGVRDQATQSRNNIGS